MQDAKELRREEEELRQKRREERRANRKTIDIPLEDELDETSPKNKKRSRIEKNMEAEIVEAQEVSEEQIKINLNSDEQLDENPKAHRGIIKGILRKSDKTAEIVDFNTEPVEAPKQSNPNELTDLFREQEIVKENKTQAILQLEHNTTSPEDDNYEVPPLELMKEGSPKSNKGGKKALTDTALKLQKTLFSFGVSAKVENVSVGPAITRYELKPAEGVRVSKIAKLSDDIALNLAAESIRIEAPIPRKTSSTVLKYQIQKKKLYI